MSQATFRSLFIGRPARVGLLLVVIVMWALAVVGPAAAQEDTPPSAPAELPAAPVGTPICGPTQNVGGAIATNTTWTAGKVYVLTGDITVNQLSTLTIQPGAVVKINYDKGFVIYGKLVARGTSDHPIYFTSIKDDSVCGDTNGDSTASVPNPGDWRWIDFAEGSSTESEISRAVIRHSGLNVGPGCPCRRAAIRIYRVVPILEYITFEDNFRNGVAIFGSWLSNALRSTTVIHVIESGIDVLQANTFSIPPGVKIKVEYDNGVVVNGKLTAAGTVGQPIVLTSMRDDSVCGLGVAGEPICDTNNDTTASVPAAGDWKWIDFSEVSSPESEISRAVIRYSGLNVGPGCPCRRAAIRIYRVIPTLEYISFEHNFRNSVAIIGGSWLNNALRSTTVIYTLEGGLDVLQANTFAIPPGAKIKVEYDTGITVNGKLLATGTAENPIVITSMNDDSICGMGAAGEPICDTSNNATASVPDTGDWKWITFTSVSSSDSEISFAVIRYGGLDVGLGCPCRRAVLRLDRVGPTIAHTAFVDNWTGIDLLGGAQPTLTCNDFEGNASPFGIYSDTPATAVVARDNWWGSVSGPTHASNPHGAGDTVSDGIDFTPWRTTPCVLPPTAPDAAFEATPTSGEAPLSVSFFNTSGGAVTNSQWAFGDGGTSTAMNPTHVYTQPGVYSVTLTVNGPAGDDDVTNTAYIQVDATTYRMFAPVIVRPR